MAKLRVVIVDDTETWRMLVGQYLRHVEGVEVVGQAGSAAEALTKCAELSPDLVLLDISLPDGRGVDVARQLKEKMKGLRVYLCSAYEVGELRELSPNAAVDGFIQKSSLKTELHEAIRHEVERHSAQGN